MRLRRILAAAVVTTLAAPTALLATSTPAVAATGTKIVASSGKSWIQPGSKGQPGPSATGDTLYLYINVVSTDGSGDPYAGTLTVQRKLAGSKSWKTIATSTYAGYSGSTKAIKNATYRAVYSGGSSGDTSWTGSSADKKVKVQRNIEIKDVGDRKVILQGKVKPKYKGKVAIYKKNGKKWKRVKMVRTNKKSIFRTQLPAPRSGRYYWNVKIKASKGFSASQTGKFYTYSYRPATADRLQTGR